MLLDRSEIDDRYSVLPYVPLPQAVEELKWVTNIFVSADLTETRRSLADYPAITITYQVVLTPDTRVWADSLYAVARNTWILPYYPHLTTGRVLRSGQLVVASPGGHSYPYHEYVCVYTNERMVYRKITTQSGDSTDINLINPVTDFQSGQSVFVVPCFKANINSNLQYQDVGPYRYGGSVTLKFRMTGDSEQVMTYKVDEFDFISAVQTPLRTVSIVGS